MRLTPSCEAAIDGASRGNPGPAGAGVVLTGADGVTHEHSKYLGTTTNNVAEYSALICALQAALAGGCRELAVKTDSELLTRQMSGQYRVRDAALRALHDQAARLIAKFARVTITHVRREHNRAADRLATRAADRGA
jgi:ribonuclease HI